MNPAARPSHSGNISSPHAGCVSNLLMTLLLWTNHHPVHALSPKTSQSATCMATNSKRRTILPAKTTPGDTKDFCVDVSKQSDSLHSRRQWFAETGSWILGSSMVASLASSPPASAACLPGDLSTDCIGVYKLPYADSADSPWLTDKDVLADFAPDIRYVPVAARPPTVAAAQQLLTQQRAQIPTIRAVVFDGDLSGAGVLILQLIPQVTAAGQTIRQALVQRAEEQALKELAVTSNGVSSSKIPTASTTETASGTPRSTNTNSFLPNWNNKRTAVDSSASPANNEEVALMDRIDRLVETSLRTYDRSLQALIAEWSSLDIEIGQALRGQRGVTAVAQIELLSDLKEATAAFDEYLAVVEKTQIS